MPPQSSTRWSRLLIQAASISALPLLLTIPTLLGQAVTPPKLCPQPAVIAPSPKLRSVTLVKFGWRIEIPSNYRTSLKQLSDGTHFVVLNPAVYSFNQCVAQGGIGVLEYQAEGVQFIAVNPKVPIATQAKLSIGYSVGPKGEQTPLPMTVTTTTFAGLPAFRLEPKDPSSGVVLVVNQGQQLVIFRGENADRSGLESLLKRSVRVGIK
jgi:hypothetical protein